MSRVTGDLLSYFDAKEVEGSPPPPSWNVAPTQDVPIITEKLTGDELDRRPLIARWGLVPSWAKDIKIGSKLINARSETILEKLLAFAGLYEFWPDPSLPEDDLAKWLLSCTVPTTTAHDSLGHVHDRAPVIIPPEMFSDWLDPDTRDKTKVQELLDSVPEPVLTPRIVSDRVNSVRNNGPELVEPAEEG